MIWQSKFPGQPYLVAEIGVNHEGSRTRADTLIKQAAAAGVDAVKFQAYKASRLAAVQSPTYFWQTGDAAPTQRQFFQRYDMLDPDDYFELAQVAADEGVRFLCTPFDEDAVAWLFPVVEGYKIASGDITHWPLLRAITATRKPVILSTGASTWDEIDRAMRWLLEFGTPHLTLLHCVLSYPTPREEANLGLIPKLKARFPDCGIGYSDHTLATADLDVLLMAAHLGAEVIEKHFTDDPSHEGNDHYHSMTAKQIKTFRRQLANGYTVTPAMEKLVGSADRAFPLEVEAAARQQARRGLYAAHAMGAGHILELGDVVAKRPAVGLEPFWLPQVIGRELAKSLADEEPVTQAHLA